jgi:hypothetical protein
MLLRYTAALLLLCAPALRAQPSQPASPSKTAVIADDKLRAWLATDKKIREKISRTQVTAHAAPVFADPDLKDSVADIPAKGENARQDLLGRLPGLQGPKQMGCQDFQSCTVPPLALDIPAGESVEAAIRAMVRPWIWLADARGTRLGVAQAGSGAQAILAMNMQGLGLKGVELNIAPRPEGGVHLWFSRGLELATLYSREHDAIQTTRS